MNEPWAKAVASVALCAAGAYSIAVSAGQTGMGWIFLGLFIIWVKI